MPTSSGRHVNKKVFGSSTVLVFKPMAAMFTCSHAQQKENSRLPLCRSGEACVLHNKESYTGGDANLWYIQPSQPGQGVGVRQSIVTQDSHSR